MESLGLAPSMHRPRAEKDCKLWSIKRNIVRAILTIRRRNVMAKRIKLVGNIFVGATKVKKMMSKSE